MSCFNKNFNKNSHRVKSVFDYMDIKEPNAIIKDILENAGEVNTNIDNINKDILYHYTLNLDLRTYLYLSMTCKVLFIYCRQNALSHIYKIYDVIKNTV